ncbi:choice-of-anchor A family protein [Allochromatium palmeri]|uniref:Choice-of-anchor A family protein n=1 Tax=Allochromatium palmeri TaxID=231048 RepID=A0A6N8EBK3_9GAMM|nr:choice-of-anchor A family protein [Allochromatium palmeri]MTW20279.1 choice-of-anchor A family protein [Allochromatium palmeri]
MHKSISHRWFAIFATLLLLAPGLSAMPINLGDAAQFNAIVLGGMRGVQSDVEGRLAVQGDLYMQDFSIGLLLENSSGSRNDLIVGGNATIRNTRIEHGNAVVAGDANTDETVGFYSGHDPSITNGELLEGDALDFEALTADLLNRSSIWGKLESTGQTLENRNDENELYDLRFIGNNDLNIFNVNADALSSPDKRITFDIPATSLALVNVFGTDVNLFNTGFFHTASSNDTQLPDNDHNSGIRHDGSLTNGILFNFVDAINLNIHSIGIKGSILAPLASTTFYNGHIDGNFIVKDLNQNTQDTSRLTGQINNYFFRGQPTPAAVDEPPIVLLLLIAIASLSSSNSIRRMAIKGSAS